MPFAHPVVPFRRSTPPPGPATTFLFIGFRFVVRAVPLVEAADS
jgi:hypothetical protein